MFLNHQHHFTHIDTPLAHGGLVDQGVGSNQVHPVVHPDIDRAIAVCHPQDIIHVYGVALPAHGAGFHHVAGAGVIAAVVRCQRPDPGLDLAVVMVQGGLEVGRLLD